VAEPIRYFFDQNIYGPVFTGVSQSGIDVLTAQQAGRCGLADPDQLAFAQAQERVLVTFDPDFLALHNSGILHASIAWCHATKYSFGQLIRLLVLLHAVSDKGSMKNRVEYL